MQKRSDWRVRLYAALDAQIRVPFQPGVHDCALFVANCIREMTGVDLAERFRGKYSSMEEAQQVLNQEGYDSLADLAARYLEEVPRAKAVTGDVAVFPSDHPAMPWSAGVINGDRIMVLSGLAREGSASMGTIARNLAVRVFRVP